MKRFFCRTCQKIRHVRRMPVSVSNPSAYAVLDRVGECEWHHHSAPRVIRMIPKVTPKRVTVSTPAKQAAGKRSR